MLGIKQWCHCIVNGCGVFLIVELVSERGDKGPAPLVSTTREVGDREGGSDINWNAQTNQHRGRHRRRQARRGVRARPVASNGAWLAFHRSHPAEVRNAGPRGATLAVDVEQDQAA
jgi:hypothetical protein